MKLIKWLGNHNNEIQVEDRRSNSGRSGKADGLRCNEFKRVRAMRLRLISSTICGFRKNSIILPSLSDKNIANRAKDPQVVSIKETCSGQHHYVAKAMNSRH